MEEKANHLNHSYNVASISCLEKRLKFQSEAGSQTDTTLQLVSPGSSSVHIFNLKRKKRKFEDINRGRDPGHAPLSLGLRCSPSTSLRSKRSSGIVCTASSPHVVDEECSIDVDLNFQLKLDAESTSFSKAPSIVTSKALPTEPSINLQLSLSVGPSASAITRELGAPTQHLISPGTTTVDCPWPTIDDRSVSSCSRNGSSLIYGSGSPRLLSHSRHVTTEVSQVPNKNLLPIFGERSKRPAKCASGNIEKQKHSSCKKICKFSGCPKGARGSSGLCIAHGGGQRCQRDGCQKGAEGKTIYCKAHGGGRRCEHLGCTKSAEGHTDLCIAHGGGRRCSNGGCPQAARGKSGLCIKHGGGKRCQIENCTKSAEGQSRLCITHGGGRRCQYPECTKGAQGSTMLCKAHGGGKRCIFPDCSKGAEGSTSFCKGHGGGKRCLFEGGGMCSRSVHGGTQFCVAHGGGKRCAALDCTKSARGRTDYCVRHGGGKRCQFVGCGKSAQGSSNFCKAHGGGKRCSWSQVGSNKGVGGPPCDRFARGKVGLCGAHSALVQDNRVHGGETIGTFAPQNPLHAKSDRMKGVVVEEDANPVSWCPLDQRKFMYPIIPVKPDGASLLEGRVHGGSLMALLASGALGSRPESQDEGCSTSNQASSYNMNYGCL